MNKKIWLILEDGTAFEGLSFGSDKEVTGEVVFSTNMTGFQESLTDPNYSGQILVQTFPLAGNSGINSQDSLSDYNPAGYIVREFCEIPSNFRSEITINEFLKKRGIVGLYGIDTRRLTRHLREKGTMNGIISSKENADLNVVKSFKPVFTLPNNPPVEFETENAKYNLALLDFGYNRKIVQYANEQFCNITVLPWNTDISGFDGVILSNGAGNPNDFPEQIEMLKNLLKTGIPIIGIGLGHQLLALAYGAEIIKLKNAHRGSNIPVKNLKHNTVFITSQNHGYAVKQTSITPEVGEIICENVNDNTCESVLYKNNKAVGFQFLTDNIVGWVDVLGNGI